MSNYDAVVQRMLTVQAPGQFGAELSTLYSSMRNF